MTPDVLKKGLAALAEVANRKLDGYTLQLWGHACRELTDEQFRHGVDVTLRTWKSSWMPPPSMVIESGFTAPVPPRPQLPPAPDDAAAWRSAAERQRFEQTARDNPIRPGESLLTHIARLAAIANGDSPSVADDRSATEATEESALTR